MADDLIESYLDAWARWHRASEAERRALGFAPRVPWARWAKTNYMVAEDDSMAQQDAQHAAAMQGVEAAVNDLDPRHKCAIFQAYGLGTLGLKWSEEMLPIMFRAAKVKLVPLFERHRVHIFVDADPN